MMYVVHFSDKPRPDNPEGVYRVHAKAHGTMSAAAKVSKRFPGCTVTRVEPKS